MPTATELLGAGATMQQSCAEMVRKCSAIVAATHVQDPVRMREVHKSVAHLHWDFSELTEALKEVSGTNEEIGDLYFYEDAENYDYKTALVELYTKGVMLYGQIREICVGIGKLGMDLKSTSRTNTRLRNDLDFLLNDLKDINLIE